MRLLLSFNFYDGERIDQNQLFTGVHKIGVLKLSKLSVFHRKAVGQMCSLKRILNNQATHRKTTAPEFLF